MAGCWACWGSVVRNQLRTKPTIWEGSVGSIEIRKVVAVSQGCRGRSRISVPLRAILDSECRRGQEGSTWPMHETCRASTLRQMLERGEVILPC